MASKAPPGARVIASTANSFLRGMKCGTKFNLVYMDCMGSVTGNRACCDFPLEDLQLMLRRHAASTIVLGMTFCARLVDGRGAHHSNVSETILADYLLPTVHAAGYAMAHRARACCYRRPRGATMAFFALVLERSPSRQQPPSSFVVHSLLGVRGGSERHFLVRWSGFGQQSDSWQPESSLPAELVAAWQAG
jgi:hypothetical protein